MKKIKLILTTLLLSSSISLPAFAGEWNNTLWPRQYKKDDGSIAISEWIHHDDAWYHFDENGYAQRGWYLDADNTWYFLRYDGVMQTGLIKVDTEVYYMDDSGALFEGEKEVYGNVYRFTANGVDGHNPGVVESKTFGGNGSQSISGGGSGGSSSTSSNTDKPVDYPPISDLESGFTDGPT